MWYRYGWKVSKFKPSLSKLNKMSVDKNISFRIYFEIQFEFCCKYVCIGSVCM